MLYKNMQDNISQYTFYKNKKFQIFLVVVELLQNYMVCHYGILHKYFLNIYVYNLILHSKIHVEQIM